eukprot:m.92302 g.92302  ORF g.92302 m.92302 type:complete len:2568 (+) comp36728_c0_seq4:63-7766(+)
MAKNTFKFKSFAERVAAIKVDVVHRIARPEDISDDVDSCFTQGLEKWRDLNSTADFRKFCSKARQISNNFRQVVHHQKELIGLLQESLRSSSPIALQPLLDLVTQLARDLQVDFSSHFQEFFEILVHLMSIRDADILESVFSCLSYLFKFLWRYLVKDIKVVYSYYCELFLGTQKNHIQRFAAESFSFLVRKCPVKDQEALLHAVFNSVYEKELCDGIGTLFFEIVKGVQTCFHSGMAKFLEVLLLSACRNMEELSDPGKILSCLSKTMELMAEHSRKEHCCDVWTVLHKCISATYCKSMSETALNRLNFLLHLHQIWIKQRRGSRVSAPNEVCQVLFSILSAVSSRPLLAVTFLDSVSSLISNFTTWTATPDAVQLMNGVYDEADFRLSVVASMTQKLFGVQGFDMHIFPQIINRMAKALKKTAGVDESICLHTLALYVHHRRMAGLTPAKTADCSGQLTQLVVEGLSIGSDCDLAWIYCSVLSLNVLEERGELIGSLRNLFEVLTNGKQLLAKTAQDTEKLLCILQEVCIALPSLEVSWDFIRDVLSSFPESAYALRLASRAVHSKKVCFSTDDLQTVYTQLQGNMSCPNQTIRLLTLQLLSALEDQCEDPNSDSKIFGLCVKAQSIPLVLDSYRNRLAVLCQLSSSVRSSGSFRQEAALRYLIGSLYINFSLLWASIIELIGSHAGDGTTFWTVFLEELQSAGRRATYCPTDDCQASSNEQTNEDAEDEMRTFFRQFFNADGKERPDHVNYRLLLWKAMVHFVPLAESKSKDIVPIFLNFIQEEYFSSDVTSTSWQDLTIKTESLSPNKEKIPRKALFKTLCAQMAVFSKFKNPKGMHREPEMNQVFLTMLAHRDGAVQKLALDAISCYKHTHVTPYKDNLARIVDDDAFRDELTHFDVDEETSIVASEHRQQLMPILIRILYGRMMKQAGGKSGRQGAASQRAVILRFLAGCSSEELAVFIDIITEPFQEAIECIGKVTELTVRPESVLPLKKQQGFLHLCSQLFSILRNVIESYIPSLFSILLYILHTTSQLLSIYRATIQPQFISQLRSMRQIAFDCLSATFKTYRNLSCSLFEKDLFAASVWPQLSKLKHECIQSPTGLLRLLHTWTGLPAYVSFLNVKDPQHETLLLGHVFVCLSSKGVTSSVSSLILEMVNNLLRFAEEGEEEVDEEISVNSDNTSLQLLLPHVSALLKYLSSVVKSAIATKPRPSLDQEFYILSRLSPFVTDCEQSEILVDTLVSLIGNFRGKHKEQVDLLLTVKNLILNVQEASKFSRPLSDLFYAITAREARNVLCDVFEALSVKVTDLMPVVSIVRQLNAWEESRVEDVDFERRLSGFSQASDVVISEDVSVEVILPLLKNAMFTLLHTEEMSLRDAAASFFGKLITRTEDANWNSHLFRILISENTMPALKKGLKATAEAVRHEHLGLLACLVRHFPSRQPYKEMIVLLSENPDADVFENMRHIQVHRRIRALRELANCVENGRLSPSTVCVFFLPHVNLTMMEAKDHNLVNEAIGLIGACAGQFNWSAYFSLLKRHLKMLMKKDANSKIASKALVAVLNAFHFDLSDVNSPEVNRMDTADKSLTSGLPLALQKSIHDKLVKTVLPQIQSILTKKSSAGGHKYGQHDTQDQEEEALRAPVVLAAVKVLQALPRQTLDSQLPGLVIRICQTLRSRSRDVRSVARSTMVKMAASLGPQFMPMLIKEMKHLLKKGYQVHVLVSTVHSVLAGLSEVMHPGDMNECLEEVIQISLDNLFGDAAEHRDDEEAGGKIPEAKACHTYDTLELVARFTSAPRLNEVVNPLRQKLLETASLRVSHCVEEALRRVGLGMQRNDSITPVVLLQFIHDVVNYGMTERKEMKEKLWKAPVAVKTETTSRPHRPELYSDQLLEPEPRKSVKRLEGTSQVTAHVFVEFALQLLLTGVKKQKFDVSDEGLLNLLDSLLPLLVSLLSSKHNKAVTLSIKLLSFMVPLPLPQLGANVEILNGKLFTFLRKYARAGAATVGGNQELIQACFKAVTVLMREHKRHKITDQELKVLLTFVEEDIYDFFRQSTAFPLLKSILSRRFLVPMLHDVMRKVEELALRSDSQTVRLNCRQCTLQFLLDYQLGKKRREHFDYLVRNLDYEVEAGRESALELLFALFNKLPQSDLHVEAAYFFVPLASRLINDSSAHCKQLVNGTIKVLLEKIQVQKRDELFAIVLIWMEDEQLLHCRLGFQTCGLFIEVEKQTFERRMAKFLPFVRSVLEENVKEMDDDEMELTELSNADHLVYAALTTLGKTCKECRLIRNELFQGDLEVIWGCMETLLEHSHAWIQLASCRLLGLLFSSCTVDEITSPEAVVGVEYLRKDILKKVSFVSYVLCRQLGSAHVTEGHGDQIVRNLLFLAEVMLRLDKQLEEAELVTEKATGIKTLDDLISQMSKVARKEAGSSPDKTLKRSLVLKWLGAFALKLGKDMMPCYLESLLKPVIRELSDNTVAKANEHLKILSQEVCDLLKSLVGKEAFSKASFLVQQEIKSRRESRKREKALDAVANPEKRARQKIKRTIAKSRSRKRKAQLIKHPAKWKRLL